MPSKYYSIPSSDRVVPFRLQRTLDICLCPTLLQLRRIPVRIFSLPVPQVPAHHFQRLRRLEPKFLLRERRVGGQIGNVSASTSVIFSHKIKAQSFTFLRTACR